MPFTPAHAAIVLPFVRKNASYLSATALIIGSFAPDFEYFFNFTIRKVHGHTVAGLLYFDLPTVILLSFLFHVVVKKNLLNNLPIFFQERFQPMLHHNFIAYFKSNWMLFSVSAIIGSASHIFWDSFTHANGFFVRHLPWIYENTRIPFRGVNYTLWYALQNLSTVVGLLIIIVFIRNMPVSKSYLTKPDWRYWFWTVIIIAIVTSVRFAIKSYNGNPVIVIITLISACCIAFVLMGLFYNKSLDKEDHSESQMKERF
ncbi:DUF4184 family protein [Chryseosolibacter indicus]|uniref:DUF4184 family protein n=1 Tax=Chryseosolibacter indicus TaxID=2782351 RepID=A0ABS5VL65_9BACT|nr:DUF4184 family protein [Chryseosolibacter indicus]MBT1701738.1 DUF4184 family protein [Chryseosolibacter indicus]